MLDCADDVIWVLGNHEFYHSNYQEALDDAYEFAVNKGIILMDEVYGTENHVIDGVKFWGSTLWTDLNNNDWFASRKVQGFNDFHVIHDEGALFRVATTYEINQRTREKINWDADVVITHHCPILLEHRRFPISDITYGFCNTGLEEQIMDSNIKYWMFGHTHDSRAEDLNGTLVVSNQQGYPMAYDGDPFSGKISYEDPHFDPALILEI